jgi:hypothetical protein
MEIGNVAQLWEYWKEREKEADPERWADGRVFILDHVNLTRDWLNENHTARLRPLVLHHDDSGRSREAAQWILENEVSGLHEHGVPFHGSVETASMLWGEQDVNHAARVMLRNICTWGDQNFKFLSSPYYTHLGAGVQTTGPDDHYKTVMVLRYRRIP